MPLENVRLSAALLAFTIRRRVAATLEPRLWLRDVGAPASLEKSTVFASFYPQFGDHWVALTHFADVLKRSTCRHRFSLAAEKWAAPGPERALRRQRVEEISSAFGIAGRFDITEETPEIYLPVHPDRRGTRFLLPRPPQLNREFVSFQFSGRSHPHNNPTPEQIDTFTALLAAHPTKHVGLPMSLPECIETIQRSKVLLCVSSGMSHIAASTETPTMIFIPPQPDWRGELTAQKHHRLWNPYPGTHFFRSEAELRRLALKFKLIPA